MVSLYIGDSSNQKEVITTESFILKILRSKNIELSVLCVCVCNMHMAFQQAEFLKLCIQFTCLIR